MNESQYKPLIEKISKLKSLNKLKQLINLDKNGVTLLVKAVELGNYGAVENLLKAGSDANITYDSYKQKNTPLFKLVDYVAGELDKKNGALNDSVKENSLKILNALLQHGANPDLVPEGGYSFNATEYAEYKDLNYLAAELYRNGSDVQTKSQNVKVGSTSDKISRAKGLVLLAKEEFSKFLNNFEDYQLPSKLHKNTLYALNQFKLNYDSEKKSFFIDYTESDKDYEQRKIDYKNFFKKDGHSGAKFSKIYSLDIKYEKIDSLLKDKYNFLNSTSFDDIVKIQSKLLTIPKFEGSFNSPMDMSDFLNETSDLLGNQSDSDTNDLYKI
jgi:hypothetical protein